MSFSTPRAVLEAYIEGSKRLDRDLLARCFHPQAVMSGDLDGKLLIGGPGPFLDDVASMTTAGLDHSGLTAEIAELTTTGRIATGTVRSSGFGGRFDFLDRFHLIELEAGWQIASKSFTTL